MPEAIGCGWWILEGVGLLVLGYRDVAGDLLRRGVRGEVCPLCVRVPDTELGITAAGTASDAHFL